MSARKQIPALGCSPGTEVTIPGKQGVFTFVKKVDGKPHFSGGLVLPRTATVWIEIAQLPPEPGKLRNRGTKKMSKFV